MTREFDQQREELKDRLLEQMLDETVAGNQPPDLVERVLSLFSSDLAFQTVCPVIVPGRFEASGIERRKYSATTNNREVGEHPCLGPHPRNRRWTLAASIVVLIGLGICVSRANQGISRNSAVENACLPDLHCVRGKTHSS